MLRHPTFLLSISLCFAVPHDGDAAIVFDQTHELTTFVSDAGVGFDAIDQNVAQTVWVGITGQLSRIEFWAHRLDAGAGDLVFDIRPTEPSGAPTEDGSSVLAEVVIPRGGVLPLGPGSPPPIEPLLISLDLTPFNLFFDEGDLFAFNFSNPDSTAVGGFGVLGNFGLGGSTGPYPDGQAFLRRNDLMSGEFFPWEGGTVSVGPVDLGFRTFVTPSSVVPEPSTYAIWSLLGLVGAGVRLRRKRVASHHATPPP